MEIKIDRYKVSKKLKFIAHLITAMGGLLFAYPIFYILSLFSELEKYKISNILSRLNELFFLRIPSIVANYVPMETNGYVAYAIVYVLFAILFMIVANFLLERNLLAISLSFIIFLSLTASEYFLNPDLSFVSFYKNPGLTITYKALLYLIFALIPFVLMVWEIIAEKDYKKEQFYVKIISSFMIIAVIILCFKGLIWMIQNKQWLTETFS